ncbi:armadillo-type protein, partial [Blastocladiella britannica]
MSAMNVDSATGHGALPADDILPIAILMDELKAEDIAVRLLAVRRLSTIALALGPDRARNELIPFLEDSTDDEDEVLAAIAEELGCFVDVVGGPAYAHLLLPTLEALAAAEETVVRDAAIAAIGKVAAVLSPVQIDETLVPLIKRLSTGDWFTSKVSAAGLYAFAYASARPEIQDELRKFFANLARDDAPMVRRAAATNMPAFVRTIGNAEHVKAELFPIFVEFAADDQVRFFSF